MFANKVVIVTGASSGIGAATAKLFAGESAQLALVGRNKDNLNKVAAECEKKGTKVLSIVADVSKDQDAERIIKETIDKFGQLDVLVNSAGFGVIAPLDDIAAFDRVMATNIRGIYKLTGLAIPHLAKTKGNVVNVSSTVSLQPYTNSAAYCASKAALDMYSKCAALELGPKGIRVNVVNPGMTKTNFMVASGMSAEQSDTFYNAGGKNLVLGKSGEAEEVGAQILHLASDKAKSITGTNLVVDNGLLLISPSLYKH